MNQKDKIERKKIKDYKYNFAKLSLKNRSK